MKPAFSMVYNATACVGFCSSLDMHVLAAIGLSSYAILIGGVVTGCRFLHGRLHEMKIECELERERHCEMVERLMMAVHDSQEDLDESDDEEEGATAKET